MKRAFGSTSNVTTLISSTTEITGELRFSGALEVEGRILGNIQAVDGAQAELRIRESGYVFGEIRAPRIVINGVVEGDVYAGEHLELAAKARVKGNVFYNLIEMVMGSEVNGTLSHQVSDVSDMVAGSEARDTAGAGAALPPRQIGSV